MQYLQCKYNQHKFDVLVNFTEKLDNFTEKLDNFTEKLDNVPNYFNCDTPCAIQILTVQIQHNSVCNTYSANTTSTNLMYW